MLFGLGHNFFIFIFRRHILAHLDVELEFGFGSRRTDRHLVTGLGKELEYI